LKRRLLSSPARKPRIYRLSRIPQSLSPRSLNPTPVHCANSLEFPRSDTVGSLRRQCSHLAPRDVFPLATSAASTAERCERTTEQAPRAKTTQNAFVASQYGIPHSVNTPIWAKTFAFTPRVFLLLLQRPLMLVRGTAVIGSARLYLSALLYSSLYPLFSLVLTASVYGGVS